MTSDRRRAAAAMGYGAPPKAQTPPDHPPFQPMPDVGDLIACKECEYDGRWVVDVVENRDQPLPRLAERRAGTAWAGLPRVSPDAPDE